MKNKSIKLFELTILVLLISIASISAFGVGCLYTNENPLKLSPGESFEVLISLQNDKEIQLRASILEGADIAEFIDSSDVYNVPEGKWISAKLKVSVPASASIGQEYAITTNFLQVAEAQGGTIGFNTAQEKSFKVLVVEPVETPKGESMILIRWIVGIIVVIAVILALYFIAKRKK